MTKLFDMLVDKTNDEHKHSVLRVLLHVPVPKDQSVCASKPQHQRLGDLQTLSSHQRDELF